jgi:hypothetical protein
MKAKQSALMVSIAKIVSGAQTGVDRAALDVAISLGIDHGGWVPKGRIAEDGRVPAIYRVRETETSEYAERTRRNVLDSDGTLIICEAALSGGTLDTSTCAGETGKPLLAVDIAATTADDAVRLIRDWIDENRISVLNVAGPRESERPGIYAKTRLLLERVFGR